MPVIKIASHVPVEGHDHNEDGMELYTYGSGLQVFLPQSAIAIDESGLPRLYGMAGESRPCERGICICAGRHMHRELAKATAHIC